MNIPINIEKLLSGTVVESEPIEVRILPNAIEIISYSGVDPSLKQIDFDSGKIKSHRYRNRRIGEFLKELKLTEGRGTGIPTIKNVLARNGSPPAVFDTDEPNRSYFHVEIPIHKEFESKRKGKTNKKTTVKTSVKTSVKILELIRDNSETTTPKMAQFIKVTERSVERNIQKLQKEGKLKRIGPDKGGHWEVVMEGRCPQRPIREQ